MGVNLEAFFVDPGFAGVTLDGVLVVPAGFGALAAGVSHGGGARVALHVA